MNVKHKLFLNSIFRGTCCVNYIYENVAIYKLVKEVTTTPMEATAKYNLYR
jgi:hypothetical protein